MASVNDIHAAGGFYLFDSQSETGTLKLSMLVAHTDGCTLLSAYRVHDGTTHEEAPKQSFRFDFQAGGARPQSLDARVLDFSGIETVENGDGKQEFQARVEFLVEGQIIHQSPYNSIVVGQTEDIKVLNVQNRWEATAWGSVTDPGD